MTDRDESLTLFPETVVEESDGYSESETVIDDKERRETTLNLRENYPTFFGELGETETVTSTSERWATEKNLLETIKSELEKIAEKIINDKEIMLLMITSSHQHDKFFVMKQDEEVYPIRKLIEEKFQILSLKKEAKEFFLKTIEDTFNKKKIKKQNDFNKDWIIDKITKLREEFINNENFETISKVNDNEYWKVKWNLERKTYSVLNFINEKIGDNDYKNEAKNFFEKTKSEVIAELEKKNIKKTQQETKTEQDKKGEEKREDQFSKDALKTGEQPKSRNWRSLGKGKMIILVVTVLAVVTVVGIGVEKLLSSRRKAKITEYTE